jgi:hypothetical protein
MQPQANEYIRSSDVSYLNRLFSEPPAIVAACNKLVRAQERSMGKEWWKGLSVALSAVIGALAIAWVCTL